MRKRGYKRGHKRGHLWIGVWSTYRLSFEVCDLFFLFRLGCLVSFIHLVEAGHPSKRTSFPKRHRTTRLWWRETCHVMMLKHVSWWCWNVSRDNVKHVTWLHFKPGTHSTSSFQHQRQPRLKLFHLKSVCQKNFKFYLQQFEVLGEVTGRYQGCIRAVPGRYQGGFYKRFFLLRFLQLFYTVRLKLIKQIGGIR